MALWVLKFPPPMFGWHSRLHTSACLPLKSGGPCLRYGRLRGVRPHSPPGILSFHALRN